jgi:hypothetical protein
MSSSDDDVIRGSKKATVMPIVAPKRAQKKIKAKDWANTSSDSDDMFSGKTRHYQKKSFPSIKMAQNRATMPKFKKNKKQGIWGDSSSDDEYGPRVDDASSSSVENTPAENTPADSESSESESSESEESGSSGKNSRPSTPEPKTAPMSPPVTVIKKNRTVAEEKYPESNTKKKEGNAFGTQAIQLDNDAPPSASSVPAPESASSSAAPPSASSVPAPESASSSAAPPSAPKSSAGLGSLKYYLDMMGVGQRIDQYGPVVDLSKPKLSQADFDEKNRYKDARKVALIQVSNDLLDKSEDALNWAQNETRKYLRNLYDTKYDQYEDEYDAKHIAKSRLSRSKEAREKRKQERSNKPPQASVEDANDSLSEDQETEEDEAEADAEEEVKEIRKQDKASHLVDPKTVQISSYLMDGSDPTELSARTKSLSNRREGMTPGSAIVILEKLYEAVEREQKALKKGHTRIPGITIRATGRIIMNNKKASPDTVLNRITEVIQILNEKIAQHSKKTRKEE